MSTINATSPLTRPNQAGRLGYSSGRGGWQLREGSCFSRTERAAEAGRGVGGRACAPTQPFLGEGRGGEGCRGACRCFHSLTWASTPTDARGPRREVTAHVRTACCRSHSSGPPRNPQRQPFSTRPVPTMLAHRRALAWPAASVLRAP